MGQTWRRCRPVEFRRVVVGLGAYWRSAFSAHVVVLVSARENEQELGPRGRRAAAPRAEQAGRFELAKALGPGHLLDILHTRQEQPDGKTVREYGGMATCKGVFQSRMAGCQPLPIPAPDRLPLPLLPGMVTRVRHSLATSEGCPRVVVAEPGFTQSNPLP